MGELAETSQVFGADGGTGFYFDRHYPAVRVL
jgi:hypothetical protein